MQELVEHLIAPVFTSEPDVRYSDGSVVGWLSDPPGGVVQFIKPVKATTDMANWLVGPAFAAMDARFPHRTDLTLLLDLKHMVGRSAAARSILLHSAKVLGPRFSRMFVVPPTEYPPMYLQAFQASVRLVRLLGVEITVPGSSRAVVDRYGIVALR